MDIVPVPKQNGPSQTDTEKLAIALKKAKYERARKAVNDSFDRSIGTLRKRKQKQRAAQNQSFVIQQAAALQRKNKEIILALAKSREYSTRLESVNYHIKEQQMALAMKVTSYKRRFDLVKEENEKLKQKLRSWTPIREHLTAALETLDSIQGQNSGDNPDGTSTGLPMRVIRDNNHNSDLSMCSEFAPQNITVSNFNDNTPEKEQSSSSSMPALAEEEHETSSSESEYESASYVDFTGHDINITPSKLNTSDLPNSPNVTSSNLQSKGSKTSKNGDISILETLENAQSEGSPEIPNSPDSDMSEDVSTESTPKSNVSSNQSFHLNLSENHTDESFELLCNKNHGVASNNDSAPKSMMREKVSVANKIQESPKVLSNSDSAPVMHEDVSTVTMPENDDYENLNQDSSRVVSGGNTPKSVMHEDLSMKAPENDDFENSPRKNIEVLENGSGHETDQHNFINDNNALKKKPSKLVQFIENPCNTTKTVNKRSHGKTTTKQKKAPRAKKTKPKKTLSDSQKTAYDFLSCSSDSFVHDEEKRVKLNSTKSLSPVKIQTQNIHRFSQPAYGNEENELPIRRRRRAAAVVSYAEPSLGAKLRRGDKIADASLFTTFTPKRKKKQKNAGRAMLQQNAD